MPQEQRPRNSLFMEVMTFLELLYYTTVRDVRSETGNAALGLLIAVIRTVTLVFVFYILFEVVGMRGIALRGDFFLFLLGGVLLFFMHNGTIGKTIQAGSQVSPMMMHAPMTAVLRIMAANLSVLYIYTLSILIILVGTWVVTGELEIHRPGQTILPFLLAWASGIAIGLIFLLIKPFMPNMMKTISTVYMRANLITSGKFFVANMLPEKVLPFFDWNPLFHTIDQTRGALFVNYVPHNTSLTYPLLFVAVGGVIEGSSRWAVSKSWKCSSVWVSSLTTIAYCPGPSSWCSGRCTEVMVNDEHATLPDSVAQAMPPTMALEVRWICPEITWRTCPWSASRAMSGPASSSPIRSTVDISR